jgi:hypothetical protein
LCGRKSTIIRGLVFGLRSGSLNALASAAGAAHDHLEAQRLREELMDLKRENESWHLELQRYGWLPPVT